MASSRREITFAEAIREGTDQCLNKDSSVFLMGLGVDDPKGIFGTTSDLHKKYGPERVFDVPISENALTGIALGAATMGMRPIFTHQRLDFSLLSMDQIINNVAKWNFMFAGQLKAPLTIRMVIGRGWGQGPQHSQSLQALFAHIPGLVVLMPTTPHDAKGLLTSAVMDDRPVIFLEHRWLHNVKGEVSKDFFTEPIGKAKVVRAGKDISVVASSYMVLESLRAAAILEKVGIDVEVVDLRTIRPYDRETIFSSVRKTGRLVVADTGHLTCGIASEIVATVTENLFGSLKCAPKRVASPDYPTPTAPELSRNYYPRSHNLAEEIMTMMSKDSAQMVSDLKKIEEKTPSDVPDLNFTGPF